MGALVVGVVLVKESLLAQKVLVLESWLVCGLELLWALVLVRQKSSANKGSRASTHLDPP